MDSRAVLLYIIKNNAFYQKHNKHQCCSIKQFSPIDLRMAELFIDPIALLFIAVVCTFLFAWLLPGGSFRKKILAFLTSCMLAGLVFAASPATVNRMLAKTERVADASKECVSAELPLVVLSGGVSSRVESVDDLGKIYQATFVRMVEAIDIINSYPDEQPVYLLGGSQRNGIAEADVMRSFFVMAGVHPERIVLERNSNNTVASANELKDWFAQDVQGTDGSTSVSIPIRLLTSALHMTRSAAVFRSAGFDVCPVPVDRQAIPGVPWWYLVPQTTALRKFDLMLHEWVGFLFYRLKGYL